MKQLIKTLLVIIITLSLNTQVYASYMVITTKQVNLLKENKVSARLDVDKKILEGFSKITKGDKDQYILDITWVSILSSSGRTTIANSQLFTKTTIDGLILKAGTSLLVEGNAGNNVLSKEEDKNKKEKNERSPIGGGTSTGGTNISGGTQSPTTPSTPPLEKPQLITTMDGCNQIYNKESETIGVYEQSYYIDDDNNKKIKEDCHLSKTIPAEKKECSIVDDFIAHLSYSRYQPYFVEGNKTYSAGGCVINKTYYHQMDFLVCEALAYNNTYIKQGKWYYKIESGENVYISDCVLDPNAEKNDLLIEFQGCPVYHDIIASQSKHLGKYYWIKPDNSAEFLGECVDVGEAGDFIHKMRFDNKWYYGENYAQQYLTRYIVIEVENNREIIIDDKELDVAQYPYKTKIISWDFEDDYNRIDNNPNHQGKSTKNQNKYFIYEDENIDVPNSNFSQDIKHFFVRFSDDRSEKCNSGPFDNSVKHFRKDVIGRGDTTEYKSIEYQYNGC